MLLENNKIVAVRQSKNIQVWFQHTDKSEKQNAISMAEHNKLAVDVSAWPHLPRKSISGQLEVKPQ